MKCSRVYFLRNKVPLFLVIHLSCCPIYISRKVTWTFFFQSFYINVEWLFDVYDFIFLCNAHVSCCFFVFFFFNVMKLKIMEKLRIILKYPKKKKNCFGKKTLSKYFYVSFRNEKKWASVISSKWECALYVQTKWFFLYCYCFMFYACLNENVWRVMKRQQLKIILSRDGLCWLIVQKKSLLV